MADQLDPVAVGVTQVEALLRGKPMLTGTKLDRVPKAEAGRQLADPEQGDGGVVDNEGDVMKPGVGPFDGDQVEAVALAGEEDADRLCLEGAIGAGELRKAKPELAVEGEEGPDVGDVDLQVVDSHCRRPFVLGGGEPAARLWGHPGDELDRTPRDRRSGASGPRRRGRRTGRGAHGLRGGAGRRRDPSSEATRKAIARASGPSADCLRTKL